MSERHAGPPIEERLDREISLRALVISGAGLVGIVVVVAAVVWGLALLQRSALERRDPPPPTLLEARQTEEPPEPRLQPSPPRDLTRFRAEQARDLAGYAWVDREAGVARIPVERAMEIALERGIEGPPLSAPAGERAPGGTP